MFDPKFAIDVGIPVAQSAYDAMFGNPLDATVLEFIEAKSSSSSHLAMAMLRNTNIFGVIGRKDSTVYVSFRGTETVEEWIQDLTVIPTHDKDFGEVADGFLDLYQLVRADLIIKLRQQLRSGDNILVIGHSLGGTLANFAALDISAYFHIEPAVLTFGTPATGLHGFATNFNKTIESCFYVTNFLDIVPYLPPFPYMHVGTHVAVNSGGPVNLITRHQLPAYRTGLTNLH